MAIRALIVDDNASFLDAASALLEREGLSIAGVASTKAEALAATRRLRPDVLLVDIKLGNESGFELARLLTRESHDHAPSVIMISTHSREEFADLLAESSAAGFVAKSELSARAIHEIVSDNS